MLNCSRIRTSPLTEQYLTIHKTEICLLFMWGGGDKQLLKITPTLQFHFNLFLTINCFNSTTVFDYSNQLKQNIVIWVELIFWNCQFLINLLVFNLVEYIMPSHRRPEILTITAIKQMTHINASLIFNVVLINSK